jgi:hypothetical protein
MQVEIYVCITKNLNKMEYNDQIDKHKERGFRSQESFQKAAISRNQIK